MGPRGPYAGHSAACHHGTRYGQVAVSPPGPPGVGGYTAVIRFVRRGLESRGPQGKHTQCRRTLALLAPGPAGARIQRQIVQAPTLTAPGGQGLSRNPPAPRPPASRWRPRCRRGTIRLPHQGSSTTLGLRCRIGVIRALCRRDEGSQSLPATVVQSGHRPTGKHYRRGCIPSTPPENRSRRAAR